MRKPLLMLVLAAALNGLTACASAPSAGLGSAPGVNEGSTPSKGSTLTIKDFADRSITFPSAPQKIVALANGEMDIVYALGGRS